MGNKKCVFKKSKKIMRLKNKLTHNKNQIIS